MNPLLAICMVYLGCCTNVIFLELLVKSVPNSGNIITFAQFLFVAVQGFIFTFNFGRKKPALPLKHYLTIVFIYFIVSVTNNYALGFKISLPLHMIFRSGSLIANMILGIIILKKRYTFKKYLSVLMVTIGIAISTIASSINLNSDNSSDDTDKDVKFYDYLEWATGISLLTFALFMSARLGIYQETLYAKHGKHPNEALFFCHAIPLPGFILMMKEIYEISSIYSSSSPVIFPFMGIAIPKLWLFLIGNVLTQFICIKGVYILTTECTSLTVTLVITLRKFLSLLFSIFYFQNPFSTFHWIGTCLVFIGTFLFIDIFQYFKTDKQKSS